MHHLVLTKVSPKVVQIECTSMCKLEIFYIRGVNNDCFTGYNVCISQFALIQLTENIFSVICGHKFNMNLCTVPKCDSRYVLV